MWRWITNPPWQETGSNYESPSWLQAGQIIGDCINDFETKGGRLSVFFVPADFNLRAIAIGAALEGKRPTLNNFEFCLISPATLSDLGLKSEHSPSHGITLDSEVNDWHFDVVNLTGQNLHDLAREIKKTEFRDVVLEADIKTAIATRLEAGTMVLSKLHEKLQKKFES
jgi:hypothetical protein